jgi:hypothetical protein
MYAYIKKINENLYHVKTRYHPKITEMFNFSNITYDNIEQVYVVPIQQKETIIQHLINLNVSVKEVKEFDPSQDRPKEMIYNIHEDLAIIFFTYHPQVIPLKLLIYQYYLYILIKFNFYRVPK